MLMASGFSLFMLLPGGESADFLDGHGFMFWTAMVVCGILTVFGALAGSAVKKASARQGLERYHADESLSLRTMGEMVTEFILGMIGDMLSKEDAKRWLPFVGTLFLYILACNLMSIIPGMQPPTDNINTNIGMALIAMIAYWGAGLARDWKNFAGHIIGPVLPLAILMIPLELLTLLILRPATLSVRLTGNLFGDHTVFNIMSGLVQPLVPVPFLGLATLVSVIQAFVFSLLTVIYISLALPHGDHDDHH